jgi:colicin import membrane protein
MKNWLVFLFIGLPAFALQAQEPELAAPASDVFQVELDRIQAERRQQEARYAREEAACYQRFAVNDCLREVRAKLRLVMEDLRRQEIAVNDEQRRLKGVEEIQRLDEKSSLKAQQEEAERREAAIQEHKERLKRAEQKQLDKLQSEKDRLPIAPRSERDKSGDRPTAESRTADKQEFEEKRRQAQESRARRDKALSDKVGKPSVRPLPTPP